MAFTGTAVVKQITDGEVRITGLSLAAAAAGTIGLHTNSGTPGVRLPVAFQPKVYKGPNGDEVALSDSIEVSFVPDATGTAVAIPVSVVKSGTGELHWEATLTNTHASTATPAIEIYVKFHDAG